MDIYYENSAGTKLYLDRAPYNMLSVTSLFDYEWQEDSNRPSSTMQRASASKEVNLIVTGSDKAAYYKNLMYLLDNLDMDVINGTPGKLYVGEYYLTCYFSKSVKGQKYINVRQSRITLSIKPQTDNWIRDRRLQFRYAQQQVDQTGRGYPYDYPYNYRRSTGYDSEMDNDVLSDMDFIMTIYGFAGNPEIVIGDQTYKLQYLIQSGEYVVIDSSKRNIVLVKQEGTVVNLFRYRDSSHIFDKIPSGQMPVFWNGSFDFDILLFEERGEPAWM